MSKNNNYVDIYEDWLNHSTGWMKEDLIALKDLNAVDFKKELNERFGIIADFGTGGLRNIIRSGTNGINDFWIKRICMGLSKTSKRVIIAYDTRNKSEYFAEVAAETLLNNNCTVYLFKEAVPTPLLSFCGKKMKCDSGIVITASHNPKEYNGFKVYDENGVQYIPSKVAELKTNFSEIPFYNKKTVEEHKRKIKCLGEKFYDEYFNSVFNELEKLDNGSVPEEEISVLYSPLHGTGAKFVPIIMTHFGIDPIIVEEQMKPDGDFPTVEVPNPENRESFDMALKMTESLEKKPQILFATDPDADRLGVFVYDGNEYVALNGNELGMLFLDFITKKMDTANESYAVLKTIVTTEMVKSYSEANNLLCYETLTGFKYPGEKVIELKQKGIKTLFSFEESFGYLYGEHSGDKDACSTAGLLALMIKELKTGDMLLKKMLELREKYGFYLESLCTYTSEGVEGKTRMNEFINFLSTSPSDKVWGRSAVLKDYNTEEGELRANVLEFSFSKSEKIIFRPSGTEPKIKAYILINDKSEKLALNKLKNMDNEVKKLFERI